MKKTKVLLAAIATLVLSACANTDGNNMQPDAGAGTNPGTQEKLPNYKKVLSPAGAPTLAFYNRFDDPDFTASSDTLSVKRSLGGKDYGMIVMDFFGGVNTVKQSKSNYKLARIITGGNLFLLNIKGSEAEPTAESHVAYFGPGKIQENLPSLALKAAFPQLVDANLHNAGPSGKSLKAVVQTGKADGHDVDYMLAPQPMVHKLSKNPKIKIIAYLNDRVKENHNLDYIPQAGLFIHETMYNQNKTYFDEQLALIDENIKSAISTPDTVAAAVNEKVPGDGETQVAKIGIEAADIVPVQNGKTAYKTDNGFGFVENEEDLGITQINNFLSTIGKPIFDQSVFLNTK